MRRQDQQYQRHGGDRFRGESGGRSGGGDPGRGRFREPGFSGGEPGQYPQSRFGREDFESAGDWRDYGEDRGEGFGGRESYADRLSRSWGGPNSPGPSQWGQGPQGGYGSERFGPEDYGRGRYGGRFGGDYGGQQTNFGGPQSNWGGYGMAGNQANPEGWGAPSSFGGQGYGSQGYGSQGYGGQQPGGFGGSGRMGYGGQGQFGQFGGAGTYGGYGGQGFGQGQGQYDSPFGAQGPRQGPKGYTRSDERIKDDVCERLFNLGDIDVSDVGVEVQNGKVTLEGSVRERRNKHQIEDIVDQCIGVRDVENRIRVSRGSAESETGSETAASTGSSAGGRGKREQH